MPLTSVSKTLEITVDVEAAVTILTGEPVATFSTVNASGLENECAVAKVIAVCCILYIFLH